MNTSDMNAKGHGFAAIAMTDNELDAVVGGIVPAILGGAVLVTGVICSLEGRMQWDIDDCPHRASTLCAF